MKPIQLTPAEAGELGDRLLAKACEPHVTGLELLAVLVNEGLIEITTESRDDAKEKTPRGHEMETGQPVFKDTDGKWKPAEA